MKPKNIICFSSEGYSLPLNCPDCKTKNCELSDSHNKNEEILKNKKEGGDK